MVLISGKNQFNKQKKAGKNDSFRTNVANPIILVLREINNGYEVSK